VGRLGGGHVPAVGASIYAPLEEAREKVLEAAREELARHGFEIVF
jgi:nanoRNase/pAp phosphatase (c-di-AMP/oligoRNAs hydrolase)